ncbi:MAG TPA: extensin family protein [Hyphomicrobiaceae bacterium]|nr:extensin family protein [Hyphomicrobiaceae bacterium]
MQTTRWAAILCAISILPVLAQSALAQPSPQEAMPEGTAGKPPGIDANWSVVLTPATPGIAGSPPGRSTAGQLPAAWSATDIEQARNRCAAMLKNLDLVAVPAEPIREGAACGAAAPVRLISVGSQPPIAFSPAPLLTCDMVLALHKWLQGDVQPLARTHLNAPVVGIKVMSSFSCRNAYGRAKTRLSEHGRVNALDVGEFLTAQGETTQVLADWGPVARDMTAKAAGDKAEAIKRKAEAAVAVRKSSPDTPQMAAPASVGRVLQGSTIAIGIPGLTVGTDPGAGELSTGLGWAPPNRLGGPKQQDAEAAVAAGATGKPAFLRAIHQAACGIFSTVLGPEANKAHKNHFHLDMAVRKSHPICE